MPAPDYVLQQGDYGQTISSVCTDEDGPVDLTGATARILMAPLSGGDAVLAAEADIGDEDAGEVSYEWQDGDTDTAGHFVARWEVTFAGGGGAVVTFPNGEPIHVLIEAQITEAE